MELTFNNINNNWYTTEQIAKGFDCSIESIRKSKFDNKDKLIEYIHWKTEPVTTVTGSKLSTIWSEIGVIKLSELMSRTQKAQDFIFEIRFQEELKKRNLPKNFAEALRLAADQAEKIEEQAKKIEQDKPKVEFADKVLDSKNSISIGEFSKLIGWGQNKLFLWLRDNKYLMANNIPYQKYIESGYFKVIEYLIDKKKESKIKTLITGKGQIYFTDKLK